MKCSILWPDLIQELAELLLLSEEFQKDKSLFPTVFRDKKSELEACDWLPPLASSFGSFCSKFTFDLAIISTNLQLPSNPS